MRGDYLRHGRTKSCGCSRKKEKQKKSSEIRHALIAWQLQAAGAALALQRLMGAAQNMREAQAAYEQYGSNEDSVTDAEAVFDGLLADMRKNFVK